MFGPTVQKRNHLRICGDISEVALPEEPELESESSVQADESSGSANHGCGGPESPSVGSTGGDGASPYCGSDVLAHSYPVPVVVKNTFIDLTPSRPVSLDGFFAERTTVSAPGSGLEPGARPAEGSNLDDKMHRKTPDWSVLSPWSNCEGSPVFEHPNAIPPRQGGIWATNPPVVGVPLTGPPSHAAPPVHAPAIPAPPKIPAPPGAPPAVWPSSQDPPTAPPPGEAGRDLLPSAGSAGHIAGNCKPCAFYHTKGCVSGKDCSFCHLCTEGEKKRRARDKREERKERRARQEEKAASISGSPHGGGAASSQSASAGAGGGSGGAWFGRR